VSARPQRHPRGLEPATPGSHSQQWLAWGVCLDVRRKEAGDGASKAPFVGHRLVSDWGILSVIKISRHQPVLSDAADLQKG
jgi:hypothetical protein